MVKSAADGDAKALKKKNRTTRKKSTVTRDDDDKDGGGDDSDKKHNNKMNRNAKKKKQKNRTNGEEEEKTRTMALGKASSTTTTPLTRTSTRKRRNEYPADEEDEDDYYVSESEDEEDDAKRRRVREEQQQANAEEERRLTASIFGTVPPKDDDDDDKNVGKTKSAPKRKKVHASLLSASAPDLFVLDRTGVNEEEDKEEMKEEQDDDEDDEEDEEDDDHQMHEEKKKKTDKESSSLVPAAVWKDDDDDDDDGTNPPVKYPLVSNHGRLDLRRSIQDGKEVTSSRVYEARLRQSHEETTGAGVRTDWATLPSAAAPEAGDAEEDVTAATLLNSTASLLETDHLPLPPQIVNIERCPNANQKEPSAVTLQAVQFFPQGCQEPQDPLLLTAGLDKTVRLFRIDGTENEKVQSIHFSDLPITSASFVANTGKILVAGRRKHYYVHDAVAGKMTRVLIPDRREGKWERCVVSPDGRLALFLGRDGYLVLMHVPSCTWMMNLKMNGTVKDATFLSNSHEIVASGSDGDVYKFDVRSRRCVQRFPNQDGTATTALAATSVEQNLLAVGASSGVVNLYRQQQDDDDDDDDTDELAPGNVCRKRRLPLYCMDNLQTPLDVLRFSPNGQVLAAASNRQRGALRLVHVASQSVFSNWPTSNTPLGYVSALDFSPDNFFVAMGNDKGQCLLYSLKHYRRAAA